MLQFNERQIEDLAQALSEYSVLAQEDDDQDDTLFVQLTKKDSVILATGIMLLLGFPVTKVMMGEDIANLAAKMSAAINAQKLNNEA